MSTDANDPFFASEHATTALQVPVAFPVDPPKPSDPPPASPAIPAAPSATPSPTAPGFDPYSGTGKPVEAPAKRLRPEQQRKVVFKGRRERERRYDLLEPFSVDDREVDHIIVRRMTTADVLDFTEVLASLDGKGAQRFPMCYLPWGELVPDDVWEAMDDDDTHALSRLVVDFLPSRYRAAPSDGPTTTGTGAPTPSTSSNTDSSSA